MVTGTIMYCLFPLGTSLKNVNIVLQLSLTNDYSSVVKTNYAVQCRVVLCCAFTEKM